MTPAHSHSSLLRRRLHQLEQTIAAHPCHCPNPTQLAWPEHHPDPNCPRCGGQRPIINLPHNPGPALPLLQQALPILQKAATPDGQLDLATLTNQELDQLEAAYNALG